MNKIAPLPYHQQVVDYLKQTEPEIWEWASSISVKEQHIAQTRHSLLRETYRLEASVYVQAHALLNQAKERLGITAPVTLYQGNEGAMNAMLCFLPNEAHIVLTGPILERLDATELLAVFGHELAHYCLWSENNGDFHVADRILHHVSADLGASASQFETARLYALFTEVYADRGGAYAAESALPAISSLVKVRTGMQNVDAASYLKQAEEINAANETAAQLSQGTSHPENYLRAQATHKWWQNDSDAETWTEQYFRGALSLTRLDLLAQQALEKLTRELISATLTVPLMQTERVILQANNFFPNWQLGEKVINFEALKPENVDESVLDYFNYVLLDLALADVEIRDAALVEVAKIAQKFGRDAQLLTALSKECGIKKRDADKLVRSIAKALKSQKL